MCIRDRCEIQLSYAIGVAQPTSIMVDTFGTGKLADDRIVCLLYTSYITEIKQTGSLIKLTMFERARINPEKIPELIAQYKSSLKFNMAENPYFTFDLKNGSVAKKRDVLDVVEELISQMRKELITAE